MWRVNNNVNVIKWEPDFPFVPSQAKILMNAFTFLHVVVFEVMRVFVCGYVPQLSPVNNKMSDLSNFPFPINLQHKQ